MRYEAIPGSGDYDVDAALGRGDLAELRLIALSISLHSENPEQAEEICLRLARHADGITRGNSVLGLGHLSRIHRRLTEAAARPVRGRRVHNTDHVRDIPSGGPADSIRVQAFFLDLGVCLPHCLPRLKGGLYGQQAKLLLALLSTGNLLADQRNDGGNARPTGSSSSSDYGGGGCINGHARHTDRAHGRRDGVNGNFAHGRNWSRVGTALDHGPTSTIVEVCQLAYSPALARAGEC